MTHRTTHPRRKKPIFIEATSVHVSKLSEEIKRIRSSRRDSPDFCVDIGARKSCIGLRELKSIFSRFGRRVPKLKWSPNRFRFADTSYDSLGKVSIPLATPTSIPHGGHGSQQADETQPCAKPLFFPLPRRMACTSLTFRERSSLRRNGLPLLRNVHKVTTW